ncbi:MAG: hypothetical protein Q7R98_02175 [Candidatus Jorgensenbacteria bacterium]|nr:hypothetical protein [Candidatus Jorgensenbacteria bacterium]
MIEKAYLDLFRAATMLSSDRPSDKVNAVYLHGLSEGMVESAGIFKKAVDMVTFGSMGRQAEFIAFNGSRGEGMGEQNRPGAAWPGSEYYIKELTTELTSHHSLANTPNILVPTGPGFHTRSETDELVLTAKERGWKSVAIMSVAWHSVRSMSCVVASMYALGYQFKAYFVTPNSTNWWLPMKGSQGIADTIPFAEVLAEIDRILKYWSRGEGDGWRKGYGAPPEMLFDYLHKREEIE